MIAFVVPILGGIGLVRFADAKPLAAIGLPLIFQAGLATLMWLLLHRKVREREPRKAGQSHPKPHQSHSKAC
jgi:hypothetical protein